MSKSSRVIWAVAALGILSAACSGNGSGKKDAGPDGGQDDIGPAEVNWVVHAGGPGNEGVSDLAWVSDGAMILVGNFDSSIEVPSGAADAERLTAQGSADAYAARLEADGQLTWLRPLASASEIAVYGADASPDGSFAVTGYFTGAATFGQGQANETVLTAVDLSDVFVARYDRDGELLWAKAAGSDEEETGLAVAANTDGSCYVTGRLSFAEVVFGVGEPNETPVLSGDYGFLAYYDPAGALVWAIESGQGSGLVTLDDGGVILTSREEGWLRHAVTRFDALGAEIWRHELDWGSGIVSEVRLTGVAVGGQEQTLLALGGSLSRPLTFDPGGAGETTLEPQDATDLFVAAYSVSGQFYWAQLVAGPGFDDEARVAVAPDGTVVLTAKFVERIGLGVGTDNETHLTAAGHSDGLVATFETDGALRWASALMTGEDFEEPLAVRAPGAEQTLVAGQFSGQASIGPGQVREAVLQAQQLKDVFLFRLGK